MLKARSKKGLDMNGVERVIGDFSILSIFDQIEISQHPELVGNGRLGFPEQAGQVADAQLILGQGIKDLRPGRVSEDLERLGQFLDDPVRLHDLPDSIDLLLVDGKNLAGVFLVSCGHLHARNSYE